MTDGHNHTNKGLLLALVVLGLLGFVLPGWAAFLGIVALSKGLVVLGLLLLWRLGLVSFGQALYFGIGGYTVGLAGLWWGLHDALALTALGTLAATAIAALLGLLIARYREIFFAMLSLAFSMILYGLLVKSDLLGSSDGFGVPPVSFAGMALSPAHGTLALYALAAVVACGAALLVHRLLRATLGHLAGAVRDSELRVEYLGVSVFQVIYAQYVAAGALAGAGGAITAMAVGHVDPALVYWTVSGEFVFITILAGTGHVAAPFLGALLFEVVRSFAMQYAPFTWQLILGVVLLLLILFLPNGLWSLARRWRGGEA